MQNCVKTAEKVWVLNPLIGKSVGVKTPTSPTGATPLAGALTRVVVRLEREIEVFPDGATAHPIRQNVLTTAEVKVCNGGFPKERIFNH